MGRVLFYCYIMPNSHPVSLKILRPTVETPSIVSGWREAVRRVRGPYQNHDSFRGSVTLPLNKEIQKKKKTLISQQDSPHRMKKQKFRATRALEMACSQSSGFITEEMEPEP